MISPARTVHFLRWSVLATSNPSVDRSWQIPSHHALRVSASSGQIGYFPVMTQSSLSDDAKQMLAKANPAVIATVRSDGQPVSAATWYLLRGERILVNMDQGRKRLEHMGRDPRVSLTVIDEADWYTHVTVIGRVTEMYDDEGLADIDALSRQYTGDQYGRRDRPRVSALIDIDRVHGWGAQKNNDQPG